jgi:DNA repair ATPase RecN
MSNKKQTAVEWLVEELRKYGSPIPKQLEEQALEMESKKLQKYDEMLEMLVDLIHAFDGENLHSYQEERLEEAKKLIKEAKEL